MSTENVLELPARAAPERVLVDGPGVYEMNEADYHRDPVVEGSLSSTGARMLIRSTPARFAYDREHGRADTKAFDYGRAAHLMALGAGMPIAVVAADDWRTKAAKEAAADARAAGATPLLAKDEAKVRAMADALRAHPVAGPLLARPGHAEQVMVYRDPESGVMCRVMVDWLPDVTAGARRLVVDYKTVKDASREGFVGSVWDYGYDQQGDFYTAAPAALGLVGEDDPPPKFVLVAQEKEPPYLVGVHPLGAAYMEMGAVKNRRARDVYRRCTEAGEWPGHPLDTDDLEPPGWQRARHDAALERGAYDTEADMLGLDDDLEVDL